MGVRFQHFPFDLRGDENDDDVDGDDEDGDFHLRPLRDQWVQLCCLIQAQRYNLTAVGLLGCSSLEQA